MGGAQDICVTRETATPDNGTATEIISYPIVSMSEPRGTSTTTPTHS